MSIALSLDFIFNDMILNIVFLCELYKGNKVSQRTLQRTFFSTYYSRAKQYFREKQHCAEKTAKLSKCLKLSIDQLDSYVKPGKVSKRIELHQQNPVDS